MIDHQKKGRRYDAQFKVDAVALVQQGQSVARVAADLGVSPPALQRWVDRTLCGKPLQVREAPPQRTPAEVELTRLRRELQEVTLQRDILKKALIICSGDAPPRPGSKS